MADLGDVLGAFLGCLARARQIADEESAVIAESYRKNPLLEGISLPRIRVPEMVIDLPVLLESFDEGVESVAESNSKIKKELGIELKSAATNAGVALPTGFRRDFEAMMAEELKTIERRAVVARRCSQCETVVRIADKVFSTLASKEGPAFTRANRDDIAGALRRRAADIALREPGVPPRVQATVLTAEVKERADETNVTRLRLVMKEEGLEWSASENPDGTVERKLIPE